MKRSHYRNLQIFGFGSWLSQLSTKQDKVSENALSFFVFSHVLIVSVTGLSREFLTQKMMQFIRNMFASPEDKKLRNTLRNLLGFTPHRIGLYRKAFTHSSAANSKNRGGGNAESYERLEFLGDAVLSAVIADYLYMKFPLKDEGFLTKMRSRIVSRQMLGKLALKFGIDKFIEAESGLMGRSNSINGDVFEAMIGAIYLDRGYAFTHDYIMRRILKFHIDIDEIEATDTDYKSKLIEWAQKNRKELKFVLVEEEGTGMNKLYVVEVTIDGVGYGRNKNTSKKKAEQEAAGVCLGEMKV